MTTATGEGRTIESVNDILKAFAEVSVRAHFPEIDKHGNPSLTRFFIDNGRMPFVTDVQKPWRYKGWLLFYVQETYRLMKLMNKNLPDRYGFYFRQIDAEGITDEPIPRVNFYSEFDAKVQLNIAEYRKLEGELEHLASSWNIFGDIVDFLAFGLSVGNEPSRLSDKAQEQLYRKFNVHTWLEVPADYLGFLYAESKTNKHNKTGFYPTPDTIVQFMTEIVMPSSSEEEAIKQLTKFDRVMDPCVGTGRMLLHASNYSLRLYGQDIDPICCKICLINGALYAPWLCFPFPETYFDGKQTKEPTGGREAVKHDSGFDEPPNEPKALPATINSEPNVSTEAVEIKDAKPILTDKKGQGLLFQF